MRLLMIAKIDDASSFRVTRSCMTARFALPYTDAVANSSSLPAPTHDCCRSENRHISDSVGGKAAKMRVRRNATSSAFTHVSQVRRTRATASGTESMSRQVRTEIAFVARPLSDVVAADATSSLEPSFDALALNHHLKSKLPVPNKPVAMAATMAAICRSVGL